jgi:ABC-2 type transport system ATP-binding protein
MPIVEVDQLSKTYCVAVKRQAGIAGALKNLFRRDMKEVHAVTEVTFKIDEGEMVAFLGPNGAGKTTTLKMLSGLIFPTAGSARVLGHVPWQRANEYRRQFALVMGQKNQLWWDLPARESFRLHREIYAIPNDQFQQTHDDLIDLLKLNALIDQPVRELSLGERMKMELVAALLHRPRVLFLDEPTIGLDVVAQGQLREFLREHNQRHRVTILLTSHYMRDVESLCDRAIVINHGRLIYDGSLAGILNRFTRFKRVKLHFLEVVPAGVDRFGEIVEQRGPVVTLQVDRQQVAATLAAILDQHSVEDVTVDEVPLEEVIARVFQAAQEMPTEAMTS